MTLDEESIPALQEKFSLSYHIPYLLHGERFVGFRGMRVLEVGGSLPRELVLDILGAETWIGVEAMRYWEELGEEGGGTRPPKDISLKIQDVKDLSELGSHRILEGQVEDLPKAMEGAFDRIFSIACFEHIHTLGLALDKMHTALKPGGKLFTMFSPIWSTHDGHHLPEMIDENGKKWDMGKSPVPPWGHLLLSPPQMERHIMSQTDRRTASQMIFNIYHNQHINRLFTEDYVEYVRQSPFIVEQFQLTFPAKITDNIQKVLESRYPGKKNFANNGILMVLAKKSAP